MHSPARSYIIAIELTEPWPEGAADVAHRHSDPGRGSRRDAADPGRGPDV